MSDTREPRWDIMLHSIAKIVEQEGWPCSAEGLRKAADALQILADENEQLKGGSEVTKLLRLCKKQRAENKRLKAHADKLAEISIKYCDENERLSEKNNYLKSWGDNQYSELKDENERYKKWFKDHASVLAIHSIGGYKLTDIEDKYKERK